MERNYKTQMEAAKMGIVTPEMKIVAQKEYRTEEEIREWVAKGQVAICANRNHKCLNPEGVGSMLRTKINVNLGVSRDCKDYNVEMKKVQAAVDMGAEAIMDLSSHGDTIPFRRKLTSECPAMIGTVPVYDAVIHYQRDLATLSARDLIDVVRLHAEDGVDFVTLHCGITRHTIDQIKKHKRKMNIVSRGGSLIFAWMCMTGNENPFYEYYDEILDICREYDVTISLGDACRPGCLADASDVCQIEELVRLGELTKRAWEKDVQVMVEGPGHMPMDQIKANMKILCNMMYDYAIERELVQRNYARDIKLNITVKPSEKHSNYTQDEMKLLWQNINNQAVFAQLLQCYTGFRPQEVLLIKISDIDLDQMTITGGMKTKAGYDRIVPIHPILHDLILDKYKQAKEKEYVYLVNSIGQCTDKVKYDAYNHEMEKFWKYHQTKHLLHDGRVHFVTLAKKYNIDEYTIKRIIGHKIDDLTERVYTKRDLDWLKTEIQKIPPGEFYDSKNEIGCKNCLM